MVCRFLRPAFLSVLLSSVLISLLWASSVSDPQDTDPFLRQLDHQSVAMAQSAYQPPTSYPSLRNLSYDDLSGIRFKINLTFFQGDNGYGVQLFQLGGFNIDAIGVNIISRDGSQYSVPYRSGFFDWPKKMKSSVAIPEKTGFSGIKLLTNSKDPGTEFAVFQGASYFRAHGLNGWYGQSARGIAIDTVTGAEEFPVFRDYYIKEPRPGDKTITIYALLDGPSITGVFRFIVQAGQKNHPATTMQVDCLLHARQDIKRIGIAPLTSMFWHGEISKSDAGDYRPEVHDTDGLSIKTNNGQWLWCPLSNPGLLADNAFMLDNPKGFGLMQRDRNWSHYQDVGAMYDRRSNAWVEPEGDWGRGRVASIQIPTGNESADNIVAFWTPEKAVKAGDSLSYHYRITWSNEIPAEGSAKDGHLAVVKSTRIARGDVFFGQRADRFVIDFNPVKGYLCKGDIAGASLDHDVIPVITANGATVVEKHTNCLPDGGWRVEFNLAAGQSPVDMTAYLSKDGRALSERWTYTFYPTMERR